MSGLLGAFDYSLDGGYFRTQRARAGQLFSRHDAFRKLWLEIFGYGFVCGSTVRNNSSDAGQPGQTLLPGRYGFRPEQGLHDFFVKSWLEFYDGRTLAAQLSGYESRFRDWEVSPFGPFQQQVQPRGPRTVSQRISFTMEA